MFLKSRDLILTTLFGFIYYALVMALSGHLTKIPTGEYFMVPFLVSIFMGIMVVNSSQILEWPLCFLFGSASASIGILFVLSYLGMEFTTIAIAQTITHAFSWCGLVAGMMVVGILLGYFLKLTFNLVFGALKVDV